MFDWRVCQAHHPKKAASFHPIFCRPFKTMPLSDPAWKFLPGGVPSTIINPKKTWHVGKTKNHEPSPIGYHHFYICGMVTISSHG